MTAETGPKNRIPALSQPMRPWVNWDKYPVSIYSERCQVRKRTQMPRQAVETEFASFGKPWRGVGWAGG